MVTSSDAVNRELSAIGATAAARLLELTHEIWQLLTQDIPELRGDELVEKLLDASIEENVSTLLHVFEHSRFLARCVEEIAMRSTDVELTAAVTARLVEVSFRYIDRVSEQVITTYQRERDRWLLTQTAVRAARVRELLASEPVDIDACEVSLGYRLRQHHLGIIAWVTGETHGSDGLDRLERLGSAAGRPLL